MYPKNAASPERIAVGAIYQISDGAIQTTGASVRVMPQGGAAGAGAGTLACDSTSGIWHYIPTQAETNYASFMVLVYKASCTSASATVVTTSASTPGTVIPEDGAITADKLASNAITNAKIADSTITSVKFGLNAITAGVLDAGAVTEIQNGLATSTALATVDTVVDAILVDTNELQTDDIPGTLATIAGYLDTEIAAILEDTNELQTNQGNWVTATGFLDAAGVRTAVGLSAANLDTQLGAIPTNTELASAFTEIKGATWSGTDTLEGIYNASGGTAPTVEEIRAEIDANSTRLAAAAVIVADWTDGGRLDLLLDAVTGGSAVNITTETTIIESET